MKRDRFWLLGSAVLALILALTPSAEGKVLGLLALPFTALGGLLRTMSLSGGAGNIAAIAIYALVCALPLVFWWRGKRKVEDWLLVLLSGVTALVLYYMVNPGLRGPLFQNEAGDIIYAGAIWSTLITWGVLKLTAAGERIVKRNIYRALRIFLLLCASSCILGAFGTNLANLIGQLRHYGEMSFPYGTSLAPTYLFLLLDFAAVAVENGLVAVVLFKGVKLLEELEHDPFGAGCVAAAGEVGRWCKHALAIVALTSLALNLGQVLMSGLLLNVAVEVRIPVFSMAVAFAILALSRLLTEGKELKDETDLFI